MDDVPQKLKILSYEEKIQICEEIRQQLRAQSDAVFRTIEQGILLVAFPWVLGKIQEVNPDAGLGTLLTFGYFICLWNFSGNIVSFTPNSSMIKEFSWKGEFNWSSIYVWRFFICVVWYCCQGFLTTFWIGLSS